MTGGSQAFLDNALLFIVLINPASKVPLLVALREEHRPEELHERPGRRRRWVCFCWWSLPGWMKKQEVEERALTAGGVEGTMSAVASGRSGACCSSEVLR